ncbi:unnamed protein product [Symbiodinium sp. CCMP2456]|nr:unnamed protein product [Symbiodinium sp. CCMP2456]
MVGFVQFKDRMQWSSTFSGGASPRTDLLKELQSHARQLDEAFKADFWDDCAGGTFGIQLGSACNWGAQSKGAGKIRQDAALTMTCYNLSVRVGAAVRKHARGLFAEASQLTTEVSDLCVAGTPATSCWYGKGSTLKHVDVGLGFVVPLTNKGGNLCVHLGDDRFGAVHLRAGDVAIGRYSQEEHFNLPPEPSGARRSLVYFIDKRVLNAETTPRSRSATGCCQVPSARIDCLKCRRSTSSTTTNAPMLRTVSFSPRASQNKNGLTPLSRKVGCSHPARICLC